MRRARSGMKSRPPIVGVPALSMCDSGPSSEIDLPSLRARRNAMSGAPRTTAAIAHAAPVKSAYAITAPPSSSATVSSASARDALSSTTSPSRSFARNSGGHFRLVIQRVAHPGGQLRGPLSAMMRPSSPTAITVSATAPARAPTSRWPCVSAAPSSRMSPSTANLRPGISPSRSNAASTDAGLAL